MPVNAVAHQQVESDHCQGDHSKGDDQQDLLWILIHRPSVHLGRPFLFFHQANISQKKVSNDCNNQRTGDIAQVGGARQKAQHRDDSIDSLKHRKGSDQADVVLLDAVEHHKAEDGKDGGQQANGRHQLVSALLRVISESQQDGVGNFRRKEEKGHADDDAQANQHQQSVLLQLEVLGLLDSSRNGLLGILLLDHDDQLRRRRRMIS
ncbi:hypothetical protein TYRP_019528 [Tyrophagus putrescentiae]|nr:hypothetical protein TYRP_019528 [Tyrophagus putrescentiae]